MFKNETTAAGKTERIVKNWAQKPMHWATHRCLNSSKGEWKTTKGVKYNWNDDLAGNYLDPLVTQWSRVIHRGLAEMHRAYDSEISKVVEKFAKSVATSTLAECPEMAEAVEQWKESVLRVRNQIKKHSKEVFDGEIQDAAREAHRTLKPKIVENWASVYEKCGGECGRSKPLSYSNPTNRVH